MDSTKLESMEINKSAEERSILNIAEAAKRLGVNVAGVRRFVKSGALQVVSYTGHRNEKLRFRAVDVARFIEDHIRRMPTSKQTTPEETP